MVNNMIFEGIKLAIQKGQTLQQAMMSFFNAGYLKKDIEDAARVWQMEQSGLQKKVVQNKKSKVSLVSKLNPFKKKQSFQVPIKKQVPQNSTKKLIQSTQLSIDEKNNTITGIQKKSIATVSKNAISKPVQKVSEYSEKKPTVQINIKNRNPALIFIFSLITFGIYFIYWLASTTKELRGNTKSAPNPWLIVLLFIPIINIFVAFYYYWKYSSAILELTNFSKIGLFILWFLFWPAAIIVSQIQLNKKAQVIPKKVQLKPTQTVSKYLEPPKPKSNFWTIFLVTALIILLGILAVIFLLKDEIMVLFG